LLWQTPNPVSGTAPGAVTIANGVLFAPSNDPEGYFYALNAANGNILWNFSSGSPTGSVSGPAIVDGYVYWGAGGPFNQIKVTFYAFALDD